MTQALWSATAANYTAGSAVNTTNLYGPAAACFTFNLFQVDWRRGGVGGTGEGADRGLTAIPCWRWAREVRKCMFVLGRGSAEGCHCLEAGKGREEAGGGGLGRGPVKGLQ